MPKLKKTQARLKLLDRLLRSGWYTKDQMRYRIFEELDESISERTLQTDLEELRAAAESDPIGKKRMAGIMWYSYKTKGHSYFDPLFSVAQMNTMYNAIAALKRYRGLELSADLKQIAEQIENKYLPEIEPYGEYFQPEIIEYSGEHFLKDLVDSCREKTVLKLSYQAFYEPEPKEHIIHPYLVKQYNGRWFLIGHNEKDCDLRTYASDRIKKISPAPRVIFRECDLPGIISQYKNIIGITLHRDHKPVQIFFRVKNMRAGYLVTKPLHQSQQLIRSDKVNTLFSIAVIPNKEMFSLFMSYGADLEVTRPTHIRKVLASMTAAANELYNGEKGKSQMLLEEPQILGGGYD